VVDRSGAADPACACAGRAAANATRFGAGYGSRCAPWNAMPDGRPQRCAAAFPTPAAAAAGAAAAGAADPGLGPWCCQSFCFVAAACPLGRPFDAGPDGGAGLFAAYAVCADDEDAVGGRGGGNDVSAQEIGNVVRTNLLGLLHWTCSSSLTWLFCSWLGLLKSIILCTYLGCLQSALYPAAPTTRARWAGVSAAAGFRRRALGRALAQRPGPELSAPAHPTPVSFVRGG
jgi:hypothetical protein